MNLHRFFGRVFGVALLFFKEVYPISINVPHLPLGHVENGLCLDGKTGLWTLGPLKNQVGVK